MAINVGLYVCEQQTMHTRVNYLVIPICQF